MWFKACKELHDDLELNNKTHGINLEPIQEKLKALAPLKAIPDLTFFRNLNTILMLLTAWQRNIKTTNFAVYRTFAEKLLQETYKNLNEKGLNMTVKEQQALIEAFATIKNNYNEALFSTLYRLTIKIHQLQDGIYKVAALSVLNAYNKSIEDKGLAMSADEEQFIIKTAQQIMDILDKNFDKTTPEDLLSTVNEISFVNEYLKYTLSAFGAMLLVACAVAYIPLVLWVSPITIPFTFAAAWLSCALAYVMGEAANAGTKNKIDANKNDPVRKELRFFAASKRPDIFSDDTVEMAPSAPEDDSNATFSAVA